MIYGGGTRHQSGRQGVRQQRQAGRGQRGAHGAADDGQHETLEEDGAGEGARRSAIRIHYMLIIIEESLIISKNK